MLGISQNNLDLIQGLINAILPLGGALGGLLASSFNMKGIRRLLIFADLFTIINCFFSLYLNLEVVLITRFFLGLIVGLNSSLDPQYIVQFVPTRLLGKLGIIPGLLFNLGLVLGYSANWICISEHSDLYNPKKDYGIFGFNNWRIIVFFPIILAILRLIALIFVYKKNLPQEYLKQEEYEKCKESIREIYKYEYVNTYFEQLKEESDLHSSQDQSFRKLFSKIYLPRMKFGLIFASVFQWIGINAVDQYTLNIFSTITDSMQIINILSFLVGFFSFMATLISSSFIHKYGRRVILLTGCGICCLSLLTLSILFMQQGKTTNIVIACLAQLYIFSYSASIGPIFWLYIAEILPPKGIDTCNFTQWIMGVFVSQFFPVLINRVGIATCFAIFGCVGLFGEICFLSYFKETKNLTRAQIHEMFVESSLQPLAASKQQMAQ